MTADAKHIQIKLAETIVMTSNRKHPVVSKDYIEFQGLNNYHLRYVRKSIYRNEK